MDSINTGVYCSWTIRKGHCQSCGHRFHVVVWQDAPALCYHCSTARNVDQLQYRDDPEPAPPAPLTWGGQPVTAPGFAQDQFERAMVRAFVDDLRIEPYRDGRWLVFHPVGNGGYVASRERCTCKAGSNDVPCKHRAILCAHLDIREPAIQRQWAKLNAERPVGMAVAS